MILATVNQKGGVAKTTSTINIASIIATEFHKKVLLIDNDPQANLTFGVDFAKDNYISVYDLLLGDASVNEAIYQTKYDNLDLIPSSIQLANAELQLAAEMDRERLMKYELSNDALSKYDYVFIDCSPSLGLLTVNAMVAADKLLIPLNPDAFSLDGVNYLMSTVQKVHNKMNPNLDIAGVYITNVDSREKIDSFKDQVTDIFGERVFENIVNSYKVIRDSQQVGEPVHVYDSSHKAAKQYISLAKELVNRV